MMGLVRVRLKLLKSCQDLRFKIIKVKKGKKQKIRKKTIFFKYIPIPSQNPKTKNTWRKPKKQEKK